MTLAAAPIDFSLPERNIALVPAEQRAGSREDIRLMVARKAQRTSCDAKFIDLPALLDPGDVVVVNTSRTIPAALTVTTSAGDRLLLHISAPASGGLWSVEVRTPLPGGGSSPGPELLTPGTLDLPGGATAGLLTRDRRSPRLWIASVEGIDDMTGYLAEHGHPIRYGPGPALPIASYQTIFATEPGSAEMPSAGRPFTDDMVRRLVTAGIAVAPIVLHSGVSSFEAGESPGEERYRVPDATATLVNALRGVGGRVIAVGTTVVRALETVADDYGVVHPGRGVTDLVVTPRPGVRAVDGLLTGWHEPMSSHLSLLEAFLDRAMLESLYDHAVDEGYLWHEFGDELLVLP